MDDHNGQMIDRAHGFATEAKNEMRKLVASIANLDAVDLDRFRRAMTSIDLCRSELNSIKDASMRAPLS